jgi:aromatic ring-opening dioxygenase LigB subunit
MVLVGAAILPHGTMILDPARPELPEGSAELHAACQKAAAAVAAMEPELIVLHTPHGLSLGSNLGVYLNPTAAGNGSWMGSWSEYSVSVRLAANRAKELLSVLQSKGHAADGIAAFGNFDAPLRWAEVVPIHFMSETSFGGSKVTSTPGYARPAAGWIPGRDETAPVDTAGPRWLILSEGCGGGTGASSGDRAATSPGKVPANLQMGADIGTYLESLPERVVFLSSGDESHMHGNSRCPLLPDGQQDKRYLNPQYPNPSPMAEPFDAAVTKWLGTLQAEALLATAVGVLPEALACGFDGKVLLHGLFGGDDKKDGDVRQWRPSCIAYGRPVYYGMVTAVWTKHGGVAGAAL